MRAKDVMTRQVFTVRSDSTVFDAAQLMLNACISAAPVVNADGQLIGIISEADLMYRVEIETDRGKGDLLDFLSGEAEGAQAYIRSHALCVTDLMNKNVITAGEDATLGEIAALMKEHHVKRVPVVRNDKVVGIVSRANLLQGLLSKEPSRPASIVSDADTRAHVVTELDKHGWSHALLTNVVVQDGVVHLWGHVSSAAVRDACRVAAERVAGVDRVQNHMLVSPVKLPYGF